MSDLKKNLAMVKQQFTRGTSWISIILNFGIITANIKLFEEFITGFLPAGVPFQYTYPFAIIAYTVGCYVIGWYDEHYGIWKEENNYKFKVSPYTKDMMKDLRVIRDNLRDDKK